MFRTVIAGASAAALAVASGVPAFAQLASQEPTFNGTVPVVCTVSDQVQATTTMSLNGGGTELSGLTNDFNFQSNGAVSVQLRAVNVTAQPTGTSTYSFAGSLNDSGVLIASATAASASSVVSYSDGLDGKEDFSVGLLISDPGGAVLNPGTYTAVLTTDCISS